MSSARDLNNPQLSLGNVLVPGEGMTVVVDPGAPIALADQVLDQVQLADSTFIEALHSHPAAVWRPHRHRRLCRAVLRCKSGRRNRTRVGPVAVELLAVGGQSQALTRVSLVESDQVATLLGQPPETVR